MTTKQFQYWFKRKCVKCFHKVQQSCVPVRTGNLKTNALQWSWDGRRFHMWVNEGIAPYMVFTNEEWISKRWNGKKNPNQNWWNYACVYFRDLLETELQEATTRKFKKGPPKTKI